MSSSCWVPGTEVTHQILFISHFVVVDFRRLRRVQPQSPITTLVTNRSIGRAGSPSRFKGHFSSQPRRWGVKQLKVRFSIQSGARIV